jgi:hypothetical protein
MTKYCITCKQDGHTYLECPRVNFFDLFGSALGLGSMATGESAHQLQARVKAELAQLPDNAEVRGA